jgi:hypothetical protein
MEWWSKSLTFYRDSMYNNASRWTRNNVWKKLCRTIKLIYMTSKFQLLVEQGRPYIYDSKKKKIPFCHINNFRNCSLVTLNPSSFLQLYPNFIFFIHAMYYNIYFLYLWIFFYISEIDTFEALANDDVILFFSKKKGYKLRRLLK